MHTNKAKSGDTDTSKPGDLEEGLLYALAIYESCLHTMPLYISTFFSFLQPTFECTFTRKRGGGKLRKRDARTIKAGLIYIF